MAVYKDEKSGTWRVIYRYTDWTGEQKQTAKRGFTTKREAQAWEREQMNKVTADLDMTFASFVEHYTQDLKTRLKENTWNTKDHIIQTKLMSTDRNQPEYSSYSRTIVTAINDHFARQDRMEEQQEWETALLKKIEAAVREAFTSCMKEFQISAAQPTAEKSEPPAQPDPPDETEANIEAFLDCF